MNNYWGALLMVFSMAVAVFGCETSKKRANVIVNEVSTEFEVEEIPGVENLYNKENLAKAQFYRLLSTIETNEYHRDDTNLNAILTEKISQVFLNGDSYNDSLGTSEEFLRFTKGKIIVQNLEIRQESDSLLTLVAIVTKASTKNSNPTGIKTIEINADLICSIGELPLFSSFDLEEIAPASALQYEMEVSQNQYRALSTIYYWMGLLEELEGQAKPFQELCESNFQMKFSTGMQINSNKKMDSWLNSSSRLLAESQHEISEIESVINDQNQMIVTMDVDWNGLTKDDNMMKAKSNQKWVLNIHDGMAFPQVVMIEVEEVSPFTIVNS